MTLACQLSLSTILDTLIEIIFVVDLLEEYKKINLGGVDEWQCTDLRSIYINNQYPQCLIISYSDDVMMIYSYEG